MKKAILMAAAMMIGSSAISFAQDAPAAPAAQAENPLAAIRKEHHQENLAKYDADKDGKLSKEERQAMFKAKREEMLAKYDANKDGKLDESEREAMHAELRKEMSADIVKAFDKDGDGKLNQEEVAEALKAMRPPHMGPRKGGPGMHKKGWKRGEKCEGGQCEKGGDKGPQDGPEDAPEPPPAGE